MIWWQHNDTFREMLGDAGFDSPETLLEGAVGELLDADGQGRELRRLKIDWQGKSRSFYLKRVGTEPAGKLLRMLVYGRKPSSGPIRELMMIQALQDAGIDVMRPVAWGEERRGGMPVRGFLLVEGVAGHDVAELFEPLAPADRNALCRALGCFVGRLHLGGFFQVVRLKDVFWSMGEAGPGAEHVFTLIDRETSKPWPGRFSRRACLHSLARAYRRTARDGLLLRRQAIAAFCEGYLDTLAGRWSVSPKEFRRKVYSILQKES